MSTTGSQPTGPGIVPGPDQQVENAPGLLTLGSYLRRGQASADARRPPPPGRAGVVMEALTAATVAGLAIVDMVKGVDRGVELREAKVVAKSGGRSGDWVRGDRGDAA